MHLEQGIKPKLIYSKNDVLGFIGNSGHSYSAHLHFTVLDGKKRESVNSMNIMPKIKDVKSPEIYDLYIKLPDDKYFKIKEGDDFRLTKNYPLLIDVRDTITGRERLGVYKISASFNGKEKLNHTFDSLIYSKKGLKSNIKTFYELYDEKGFYKIDNVVYLEGKNTLSVIAIDYNGNKTEKTFKFEIQRDME